LHSHFCWQVGEMEGADEKALRALIDGHLKK
jgi:hypothetical protein